VPDTFQAVAVLVLAVLPGALYVWAFERIVGPWGIGFTDRLLRFIGISAGLHVLLAPVTYRWYRLYVHSGDLAAGKTLPLAVWITLIAYVFVPMVMGFLVGHATRRNARWSSLIVGEQPAPRAWDELFLQGGKGYVRLKLKSEGNWVAGWFGSARLGGQLRYSRIARYPETQDLYLVQTLKCDERSGEFLLRNGHVIPSDVSLLVRWEEVEYLYFQPVAGRSMDEPKTQEEPAPSDAE
jgi:hypothetical protein